MLNENGLAGMAKHCGWGHASIGHGHGHCIHLRGVWPLASVLHGLLSTRLRDNRQRGQVLLLKMKLLLRIRLRHHRLLLDLLLLLKVELLLVLLLQ